MWSKFVSLITFFNESKNSYCSCSYINCEAIFAARGTSITIYSKWNGAFEVHSPWSFSNKFSDRFSTVSKYVRCFIRWWAKHINLDFPLVSAHLFSSYLFIGIHPRNVTKKWHYWNVIDRFEIMTLIRSITKLLLGLVGNHLLLQK